MWPPQAGHSKTLTANGRGETSHPFAIWGYALDSCKDRLNGLVCARRAFVNLRAFASLRWGYKKPPQRLKDAKNHQGFLSA